MSRTELTALVFTASALAASGCGGSKPTTTTTANATTNAASATSGPLTRSQLIAKADAICTRVNNQRESTRVTTPQDYARLMPQLAAYRRSAYTEMSMLRPPAEIAGDWHIILIGAQTLTTDTAKLGEAADSSKFISAAQPLIKAMVATQTHIDAAAARAGLSACSHT